MDISFRNHRLARTLNAENELKRLYGKQMAETIQARLDVLRMARNLAQVPHTPPSARHQLKGNRKGQFAVALVHPWRLVFKPDHSPIPRKNNGEIDLRQVTAVKILEVVDYH
ncbi:MAG: type II toxin-antitoxin system RelE/ParE family toxin [Alphaproteobacteria bacterium]|nr:type II toxin-antitoxin system RelE/ParE family toxin [Alphaproteobacteria bacterium]